MWCLSIKILLKPLLAIINHLCMKYTLYPHQMIPNCVTGVHLMIFRELLNKTTAKKSISFVVQKFVVLQKKNLKENFETSEK